MQIIEMFLTGTAAVIAPVGAISYKDVEFSCQKPMGELSTEIRNRIVDIQVIAFINPFIDWKS